jgi:hypothetical protein
MSKRKRQRRKRRKARKLGTVKVRRHMPPPCRKFGGSKAEANKAACRGRVQEDD